MDSLQHLLHSARKRSRSGDNGPYGFHKHATRASNASIRHNRPRPRIPLIAQ